MADARIKAIQAMTMRLVTSVVFVSFPVFSEYVCNDSHASIDTTSSVGMSALWPIVVLHFCFGHQSAGFVGGGVAGEGGDGGAQDAVTSPPAPALESGTGDRVSTAHRKQPKVR
ncbi:hypothetical protein [Endothiovibrio diazotrophicus]